METFMIILLLTLPNVQPCQRPSEVLRADVGPPRHADREGTVTEGLLGLYHDLEALTLEIVNSSSFDRNAELRAAGLSTDSTVQQCLFKKTEEEEVATLKYVCNKFFDKDNVHNAFVDSINRHLVYIDCATNLPYIANLNTKTTNSACYCATLQEHPNEVGNKYNILTTSYNPGCMDEQINLSKYLFHKQEHLAVVALANIPDLLMQPGTFDNLELLDFVSLADNGLDAEDLPPGLFCNNMKLRKLHLQGLQFTTFPSHLFNCSQTVAEMQCLPQLSDVIIQHTSIDVIPPSPFGCVKGITRLLLTNNHIEDISTLCTENLNSIRVMHLQHNRISSLQPYMFQHLTNLRYLQLSSNKFTQLRAEWFFKARSLEFLMLNDNQISRIDGVLDSLCLVGIHLDHNLLQSIIYYNVFPKSLELLKLSFNLWKTIPCLSYIKNVSALYLDFNDISYIKSTWCFKPNLLYLDLKFNSIEKIEPGSFLTYPKLRTLILTGNSLELNFALNYFKGAPLLNLNLDDNRIDSLENLFLHMPMYNLQSLVLDFNPITCVPKQPTLSATKAPLIVYIRSLSLAKCNITSIHPQAFANFVNLENIDLSWNQITYFQNLQLHYNKPLVVNMQDNNIECTSRMKWLRTNESLWHLYNFTNYPINGSQVVFNNLPVVFNQLPADLFVCKTDAECDTRMCICYAKNLNSEPSIVDCSDRDSSSLPKLFAKTAKTIFLHNNNYKFLSLSQNSSVGYKARILTLHNCNIEQMAASSFTKFTYLEELYLNDNKIIFLQNDIIAGLTLLKILTLNGNFLVEISRELLLSNTALQVLYLHSNSLRELTTQARQTIGDLYNLTMLSLYDNPWICQCDNSSWKRWLSDLQPTLKNFQDIKCDNGASVLRTPDKFFLCPNDTVVQPLSVIQNVQDYALAACLSVVLPLTVIIVMALSFYHRHLLAVFMFSLLGVRFHKDTSTGDFNYDAILLYDEEPQNEQEHSSNDTVIDSIHKWMTSVDPPYKVMLPIVDIDGGTNWAEEIARGISNSKMSVLYITMEFLEKQQTMNVFSIAYSTSMERQSIDLILIIDGKHTLEYLRSSRFEDPRLKALLRANKCILYHDKHFFKKLMYLLPGKKRSLNSTPTEEHLLHEL